MSTHTDLGNDPAGATAQLACFSSELRWHELPSDVVRHAKLCILDAIGCCLHGSTLPWTQILAEVVEAQGGTPQASIWGTPHRTAVAQAALVNCAAGHAFELDDLHTAALIHATTLSTPVALAFAERDSASGQDVLLACVAGFEVGLRVGIAGTHGLFQRGFHPQGTTGVFSAAATAARMLRLDAGATRHTLGIAASLASGLMAAQEGAMAKRLHSGHGGQSGVMAALLAERGYTGIANAIEAPYGGFLQAYSDAPAPAQLVRGLGEHWETLAIGFKRYPTVSCIHGPLDLLREIMAVNQLRADDIAGIEVRCGTFTHRHTVWPYRASGLTEAQMNMYFGLSLMALDREVFVDQFREERLSDPRILAFMERIAIILDPAIDALGPPFRDKVHLMLRKKDGTSFSGERTWRPGSPEDPLSAEEIREKLRRLVAPCWPRTRTEQLIELVDRLDTLESVRPLVALLRD
jgi:2-methylcitrate dehydratase PrpD